MLEKDNDLKLYIDTLWRHKWLIIGLFVVAVLTAGFVVFRLTPIYQTSATIMIKEKDGMSNLFDSTQVFNSMFGKDKVATYSKMIKTRTMLDKVIDKLDLRADDGKRLKVTDMAKLVNVTEITDTDLIEISVENKDPALAQKIANALVEEFQLYNQRINQAELSSARQFIEIQLREVQDTLKDAEEKLLEYKKETNTIMPDEEAKEAISSLTDIEKMSAEAKVQLGTSEASLNGIKEALELQDRNVISSTIESTNPLIKQYKAKLSDLETQLVGFKAKYTDENPEIVQLNEQIQKVKDDLKKEVEKEVSSVTKSVNPIYQNLDQSMVNLETDIIGNRAKIEAYNSIIAEYQGRLQNLPEKELELIRRQRVASISSDIYSMLMTRHEEIQISEAMQISNVVSIDEASVPEKPIKPNKKLALVGAGLAAILLGIGLAFMIEYLDTTVKSADDIEQMLGIPVLGNIPDIQRMRKRK